MKKLMTLCIIHKDSKVLLGMKKRGFGKGRWNGFGGKVKESETIEEGVERELYEEAGIKTKNICQLGFLEFSFENSEDILEVHIFRTEEFQDEIQETEEMKPEWFLENEIPFEKMWPGDKFWMPLFLKNKKFKGEIFFDRPSDENYSSRIIRYKIEEIG